MFDPKGNTRKYVIVAVFTIFSYFQKIETANIIENGKSEN